MTREEMEASLKAAGWNQWYNNNYWVHEDLVKDKSSQDFTYYGRSFEEAWKIYTTTGPRKAAIGRVLPIEMFDDTID